MAFGMQWALSATARGAQPAVLDRGISAWARFQPRAWHLVAQLRTVWAGAGRAVVANPLPHGPILASRHEATSRPAAEGDVRPASSPEEVAATRFGQLILPHLDAAYNLARFLGGDATAAEDIVQDAFLRAFRSFGDFRGGSTRSWILAIVRNCHHDWWRERQRVAAMIGAEPRTPAAGGNEEDGETFDPNDLAVDPDTPEAALLRRSEAETVRSVLDSMPADFREVLILRELEECSYREIAEVTAVPLGTVMSRLARARKMFATLWGRRILQTEEPR